MLEGSAFSQCCAVPCRNHVCTRQVHTDKNLVEQFCCRRCRLSFAKAFEKAAPTLNAAVELECCEVLQRFGCQGASHGPACENIAHIAMDVQHMPCEQGRMLALEDVTALSRLGQLQVANSAASKSNI